MQVISDKDINRLRQKVANQEAYIPVTDIDHVTLKGKLVYYQILVWHEEAEEQKPVIEKILQSVKSTR